MVNTRWVSAGYFDAMGTRLREGRAIEDSDVEGRLPVIVVNEAFARRYYPGVSAIGKRFRIRGLDASDSARPWSTIVGVVADVRHSNLEDAPPAQVYSSVFQGEPPDSLAGERSFASERPPASERAPISDRPSFVPASRPPPPIALDDETPSALKTPISGRVERGSEP